MDFIAAKSILQKVKYGEAWYGIDYNVNLYKGCSHGCIYCDSRSSCYNIENFDTVRGKKNALAILEQELRSKKRKGIVGMGAMSDTYNPQEIKYKLTRGALELFAEYGFGVAIDTKSDLILRDIDILKEINRRNNVIVKISITTPHDDLAKIIEPHVCPTSQRLNAVKILNDSGIFAGVMMNPTLPFITDSAEDIAGLIQQAARSNARFIQSYFGMTLRENQRDYYYNKLDKHFPDLRAKYESTYGDSYECAAPDSKELYQQFTALCSRYGLLYKMADIIKAYKINKSDQQLTLFDF